MAATLTLSFRGATREVETANIAAIIASNNPRDHYIGVAMKDGERIIAMTDNVDALLQRIEGKKVWMGAANLSEDVGPCQDTVYFVADAITSVLPDGDDKLDVVTAGEHSFKLRGRQSELFMKLTR